MPQELKGSVLIRSASGTYGVCGSRPVGTATGTPHETEERNQDRETNYPQHYGRSHTAHHISVHHVPIKSPPVMYKFEGTNSSNY